MLRCEYIYINVKEKLTGVMVRMVQFSSIVTKSAPDISSYTHKYICIYRKIRVYMMPLSVSLVSPTIDRSPDILQRRCYSAFIQDRVFYTSRVRTGNTSSIYIYLTCPNRTWTSAP